MNLLFVSLFVVSFVSDLTALPSHTKPDSSLQSYIDILNTTKTVSHLIRATVYRTKFNDNKSSQSNAYSQTGGLSSGGITSDTQQFEPIPVYVDQKFRQKSTEKGINDYSSLLQPGVVSGNNYYNTYETVSQDGGSDKGLSNGGIISTHGEKQQVNYEIKNLAPNLQSQGVVSENNYYNNNESPQVTYAFKNIEASSNSGLKGITSFQTPVTESFIDYSNLQTPGSFPGNNYQDALYKTFSDNDGSGLSEGGIKSATYQEKPQNDYEIKNIVPSLQSQGGLTENNYYNKFFESQPGGLNYGTGLTQGGVVGSSHQEAPNLNYDLKNLAQNSHKGVEEYTFVEKPEVLPAHLSKDWNPSKLFSTPNYNSGSYKPVTSPSPLGNYPAFDNVLANPQGGVISATQQPWYSDLGDYIYGKRINGSSIRENPTATFNEPFNTQIENTSENGINKTRRTVYRIKEPKVSVQGIPIQPGMTVDITNTPMQPMQFANIPRQPMINQAAQPFTNAHPFLNTFDQALTNIHTQSLTNSRGHSVVNPFNKEPGQQIPNTSIQTWDDTPGQFIIKMDSVPIPPNVNSITLPPFVISEDTTQMTPLADGISIETGAEASPQEENNGEQSGEQMLQKLDSEKLKKTQKITKKSGNSLKTKTKNKKQKSGSQLKKRKNGKKTKNGNKRKIASKSKQKNKSSKQSTEDTDTSENGDQEETETDEETAEEDEPTTTTTEPMTTTTEPTTTTESTEGEEEEETTTEAPEEEEEEETAEEPEEEPEEEDSGRDDDSDTTTSRPTTTTTTASPPSTQANYVPPYYPPYPPYGVMPPPFPYSPEGIPYPPHPYPPPPYSGPQYYGPPHPPPNPQAYHGPPHPEPHKTGPPHPPHHPQAYHGPPHPEPHRPPYPPYPSPQHRPYGIPEPPPYSGHKEGKSYAPKPYPIPNPPNPPPPPPHYSQLKHVQPGGYPPPYPYPPPAYPPPPYPNKPYPPHPNQAGQPPYPPPNYIHSPNPNRGHPPYGPNGHPPPPQYIQKGQPYQHHQHPPSPPPQYRPYPPPPSHYKENKYPVPKGNYEQVQGYGPRGYNDEPQYDKYQGPHPLTPHPEKIQEFIGPVEKGDHQVIYPTQYHTGAINPYQRKGADTRGYRKHTYDKNCDLPIPDGVILPYSSGAPYPPALNEYYLPITPIHPRPNEQVIKKGSAKQVSAKQKRKPVDEFSDGGPTYTFLRRAASEQLLQIAVPQDLGAQSNPDVPGQPHPSKKNNNNNNNNGWIPISGRTYNSYTFPCKGKTDGLYADVNYGCEVYYKCKDNGIDKKFKCPSGMRFNKTIQSCDFGHQVMCGQN